MNKNIILIIILIVVLVGGGVFVANQGSTVTDDAMMEDHDAIDDQEEATMEKGGSNYVEYSEGVLEELADKRRVLYFYANWCPTCRPADADFQANSGDLPEDLVLIRVNYNDDQTDAEEETLAEKYNVTYQHTFVQIDEEGNEVTKWNGGQLNELLKRVK